MSDYWDSLAGRTDGLYTAQDFEAVAYRLVSEQVLYYTDLRSRVAFSLVDQYEREFIKILSPLGIVLQINRQLRYAVAIPKHAKTTPATVPQTLFALVLRGIYEESARVGYLSEEGEVVCDFIELAEKYRLMTRRELAIKGEFDSLMRIAKRWGIARRLDDAETGNRSPGADGQVGGIAIRPGIVDVLGETALQRLALWQASNNSTAAEDQSGNENIEEPSNEAA